MAITQVKEGVVMLLMIMLVVTQALDATQLQKTEPNGSFVCKAKCLISCFHFKEKLGRYILCIEDCQKHCNILLSFIHNNGIHTFTFFLSF